MKILSYNEEKISFELKPGFTNDYYNRKIHSSREFIELSFGTSAVYWSLVTYDGPGRKKNNNGRSYNW